jgi:hypothetical protein
MYANSARLAREHGQQGCRKISRVGRPPTRRMELPSGQPRDRVPASPGRLAWSSRRAIPEPTTNPQTTRRLAKINLNLDRRSTYNPSAVGRVPGPLKLKRLVFQGLGDGAASRPDRPKSFEVEGLTAPTSRRPHLCAFALAYDTALRTD